MTRQSRARLITAVLMTFLGAVVSADVKFLSVYKHIDAPQVSFFGKKVAALVISKDDGLRVPAEEALARELTQRGMNGVATYRIAPKEELLNVDTAKAWFQRVKVDGVVALRPVSVKNRTTYTPVLWASSYYSSFWGYYPYGWGNVWMPDMVGNETVLMVENVVYDMSRDALMWAGVVETTDPRRLQQTIADIVKATVKEMQKNGLAKKNGK